MSKHKIDVSDFSDGLELNETIARSFGQGTDKELVVIVNIAKNGIASYIYTVYDHKIIELETVDINAAVEKYNEL